MIQKFISINNIGSFETCSASGDVELRRLTVLSAENGRGKTTICDLLRSVKTGDPSFLLGRTRLGGEGDPSARLLVDGRRIGFDGAAWTESLPDIEIFDSTFVCRNVFSGDVIDHDHKKNLYQVIVGERGVALAERVTELDGQSREASRSITEAENRLRALLPRATQVDPFLALPPLDGIDQRISEKKEELERTRRGEEIGTHSSLAFAPVPAVLAEVDEILQAVAGEAPSDSLQQIEKHLSQHTAQATEDWLSAGTSFVLDTDCPYCGQSLEGLPLYEAYRAVFQERYRELISAVELMISQAERVGEGWNLDRQTQVLELNAERGRFWAQFGVEVPQAFSSENLEELVSAYRASLVEALSSKLLSPFDPLARPAGLTALQEQVQSLSNAVQEYNQRVQAAIQAVEAVREEVARADVGALESEMAVLELMKLREDEEVSDTCEAVNEARAAKQRIEDEKENTKRELDEYAEAGFPGFEQGINDLLEKFGANFRISGTRRSYVGGRPSSSFRIRINDVDVELGDSSTSPAEPSFRNTLSSGDKSTLALAFFLQKLEHDERLGEKIVVLDDPFSSQDRSRRTCTMQRALRLAERAEQVLVLSHEPGFLKTLWEAKGQIPSKALQLTRIGISSTTITEWNIEEATRAVYHSDLGALQAFLNQGGGELIDVVRKIRPVIEGFLRFNFHGAFQDNEWLGDFIRLIRAAPQGTPLCVMNDQVDEIEEINDFSKKYHHAQNPSADDEPIDEGEVKAFVRRTVRLVSGV